MRAVFLVSFAVLTLACGAAPDRAAKEAPRHPKITQFYAVDKMIPRGVVGKLCYGVENATKVELDPPSPDVWPASARCFDVSPVQKTTFTLTAWGRDGSKDTKSVEMKVGSEPPRIYDLAASLVDVRRGQRIEVCFKVENAIKVNARPGRYAPGTNCVTDNPRKTTTYRIVAYGADHQQDTGTVTVRVR